MQTIKEVEFSIRTKYLPLVFLKKFCELNFKRFWLFQWKSNLIF